MNKTQWDYWSFEGRGRYCAKLPDGRWGFVEHRAETGMWHAKIKKIPTCKPDITDDFRTAEQAKSWCEEKGKEVSLNA